MHSKQRQIKKIYKYLRLIATGKNRKIKQKSKCRKIIIHLKTFLIKIEKRKEKRQKQKQENPTDRKRPTQMQKQIANKKCD